MRYLLAEEILAIHDRVLEEFGGLKGIRDLGLLLSIAERPKLAMMGKEFYPDIFSKAAAYFEAIATYHVFSDGNKRCSITATQVFLRANGYALRISTNEAFRVVMDVAVKKKTVEEIAKWLKKSSKKIK